MNKELIITLAKVAIIAVAVLASPPAGRIDDKSNDLKQRILALAQNLSANDCPLR